MPDTTGVFVAESLRDARVALRAALYDAALELLEGCRNRIETDTLLRFLAPYQIVWPGPRDFDADESPQQSPNESFATEPHLPRLAG